MLFSIEACYNLCERELKQIEQIEVNFLRELLKLKRNVNISQIYSEVGLYSCRFEIWRKKIMYLQHILKQPKNSVLLKFLSLTEEKLKLECIEKNI